LRRILQEGNNSGVLFNTAAWNSCCFLPCLSQISAVVGVFFVCTLNVVALGES
jgi:hypothetical protein